MDLTAEQELRLRSAFEQWEAKSGGRLVWGARDAEESDHA